MTRKVDYSSSVAQLFDLGRKKLVYNAEVFDYQGLGLSDADFSELIRLATDVDLHLGEDVTEEEALAPVHAWRALGQLRIREGIVPLFEALAKLEDTDWTDDLVESYFNHFGSADLLEEAKAFALNSDHNMYNRLDAVNVLTNLSQHEPETRPEVISILSTILKQHLTNDPGFNGLLIAKFVDINAVEAIEVIEEAYRGKNVDYFITGGLGDVQEELGLPRTVSKKEEAEELAKWQPLAFTGLDKLLGQSLFGNNDDIEDDEPFINSEMAKKKKQKRKMAQASQKKNRKRKK